MQLRPYQNNAVSAVDAAFKEVRSALIVLPTGAGKTIVFSKISDNEIHRGGRVLILAHRGELLEQAIDKLYKSTGIVAGLEKAESTSEPIGAPPYMVVVGSVQSMCRESRLARFGADDFSLIVIDECHHALSSTYRTIFDHFPNAHLLGVTATPDRGDLRSLGTVFEKIAFEYTIVEAIKDGFLSPIRAQTIPLRIDLTGVATTAGDYQASGLGCALEPYLHQICREIKQRAADRKTVVFTPLIATSRKMLDIFREEGVENVREVNGESFDRKETMEWFHDADPGCVLLNSMLLTEGWDEPSCDCICVLRATKSRALYVQMVGRGTRLSQGKQNLLLLDFLWMTSTHDLCRPAHILSSDDDVCEIITKKQEKSASSEEEIDLTPEMLESCESETVKKREEALAKKLREMRRKQGRLVDPLQYAYSIQDVDLTNYKPMTDHDARQPTMEQLDRLERLGFGCPDTFGAADILIRKGEERQSKGLAAPKEIRLLERRGFKNVGTWSHTDAHKMIGRMVVNGWRVPYGINPETYQP